jgi:protein-S-isoprenylcysteine O-methyltransferase Ste14
MELALVLLLGFNLALIGSLPLIFFRSGRLNPRWWVTALPFFAAAGLLALAQAGILPPWQAGNDIMSAAATVLATGFSAGSIALIALTLGVHRTAVSLWHQDDDAPQSLVTHGPYSCVRHPFYAGFLLALAAVAVAAPHPATGLCFLWGLVALRWTAIREEHRLLAGPFAQSYATYVARTGRLLPRLRGFVHG